MTGQIIKRGDSWLVRIFLGRDANGKRKYFNKTLHGTKKEAQTFLTAKLRERDLGVFVEPAAMFLKDFLDRWLEDVSKQKVREKTFHNYVSLIRCHISGKIGSKRVSDIQAYEIQKLYNDMGKMGYSPKTVKHVHNVLSSALNQAVKWKMLIQNPCDLCELPRQERKEMKYLTPEQTTLFLDAANEDPHFLIFLLAIETGMRPGEYLGLQWRIWILTIKQFRSDGRFTLRRAGALSSLIRRRKPAVGTFHFLIR